MSDISLTIEENTTTINVDEADNLDLGLSDVKNASSISFVPVGSIESTNLQDALAELSQLEYSQDTAPSGSIKDGALWYDTDDDQVYVHVDGAWKEFVIEQYSGDIDGGNYS